MNEERDAAYTLAESVVSQRFDHLSDETVSATVDALFDALAVALSHLDLAGLLYG